ncbi:MAG: hypothetical protein WB679_22645 [Terracidiphilus sp.]
MPVPLANPSSAQERLASSAQSARAQLDAPVLLRLWHLTSLDAPTVAVIWSLSFAWAAGVHLPRWIPVLLALGTWAVYVGDRLLDTRSALRSGNLSPLRERHFFHWHYRRVLVPFACTAAILAAAMVFSLMPPAIRERNSVLAIAALVYFSGVHLPRVRSKALALLRSKELIVATLFTAGCAVPVFARMQAVTNSPISLWPFLFLVIFFAALAGLNCSAIDCWESAGKAAISTAAFALAAIGLLFALGLFFDHPRISALSLAGAASAVLLGVLDLKRSRLTPLALRCLVDLLLLTPILCFAR